MQTLKDDVRSKILTAAQLQFLQRGYLKTSMRDVAKAAGIGVGNIYNYFRSKDKLFCDVVSPVLSILERLLQEHHGRQSVDVLEMISADYLKNTVGEYISLIKKNRKLMTVLLFRAQGSSLERFKEDFTNRATSVVGEWFVRVKAEHPAVKADISDFTIHLHTVWEFALFEEIIMHDVQDGEIDRIVSEYVRFEIEGWKSLMDL